MRGYLLTALGALGISWAPVLYALAGVGPAAGALFRFLYALPATHGGVLLLIQPVSCLVLGWWLLGQALSASRVAGALMVLAGIGLALLPRRSTRIA